MTLDFSRCRDVLMPDGSLSGVKEHVKVGVEKLINHPFFFITDEMGLMKSVQVIIAAQMLFEAGVIDKVLVVAPSSVRTGVWFDQELGELARHLWHDVPSTVTEYHAKRRTWQHGPPGAKRLEWMITNYEFVRRNNRLVQLLPFCTLRTLIVGDESSALKTGSAKQTKAFLQLRRQCGRVVLLNGTPLDNHPGDLHSQGNILSPTILNCPSYTLYCTRYAIMKPVFGQGGKAMTSPRGFPIKVVDSWSGIAEIQARFAPYVLRRLSKDCLDLPPRLPPVTLTTALTPETWQIYKDMRDELVVWLTQASVSMAPQAITKIIRLSQITSGFLGGVEGMDFDDPAHEAWMDAADHEATVLPVQAIGREKLDTTLDWLDQRWNASPNLKIIIRSRSRAEMLRFERELRALHPHADACRQMLGEPCDCGVLPIGLIIGGQRAQDRAYALRLLDPRTMPDGRALVIMSISAGSLGLNLTGSHTMFSMSTDYSLKNRLQGDARIHRPGQTEPVWYGDLVATGPLGQKTIDHAVLATLSRKDELVNLTTAAWVSVLTTE